MLSYSSSYSQKTRYFFVYGDSETGPLGYYHYVEERRPDMELVNLQGLVYGNRLFPVRSSERRK